jgi:pentatricopeptide repeat protein
MKEQGILPSKQPLIVATVSRETILITIWCVGITSFTMLVDMYGKHGDIPTMLQLFEDMKKTHRPSLVTYNSIIRHSFKAGTMQCRCASMTEGMG